MKRHDSYTGRGDLGSSLVLIFPLILVYEVGVLFAGRVNGADFITRQLWSLAGSRNACLALYAAFAIGFLIWIRQTQRWGTLRLSLAAPVVLEAAIYALTLGALVSLIIDRLFGRLFGLPLGPALGITSNSAIAAVGAGVHEELVFRLAMIAGIVWLARRLDRRVAIGLAFAGSSLAFAAAHHLGAHGEPWAVHAFAFRAVAGGVFAAIFWFRSLAHAVYAHVLYDLLIAATA